MSSQAAAAARELPEAARGGMRRRHARMQPCLHAGRGITLRELRARDDGHIAQLRGELARSRDLRADQPGLRSFHG